SPELTPSSLSSAAELPLERLRCWPGNPRTIRPERLEQLKQALAADPEMLQARPLLALPDGTVIAGNQRLLAARELGWETIPVLSVAREPERLRRLLGEERPEVLWSDPPYGVSYVGKTKRALRIAGDDGEAPALLEAALRAADPLLAPSARFYLAVPAGTQGTALRLVP